ncbi:Protein of unknown function [Duganella sp. CF517]|uniref:DUF3617 domain-containing protein n=1 Tax=Duganella sp. CF517 TaxID=1881038 RepID=UPI0008B835DB|nr:DUF3617 domain-containing protein [Duganella sp. CF517]SEN98984.1 Protein of unknown function [Duganella sp. CF517]
MKRFLIALALLSMATAQAQTIKPGLWELNNTVKTGDIQTDAAIQMAMQQLANKPPAQRAQMEAMLAQNGVSVPKVGGDGSMTVTACVTPEMAAKKELPLNQKGNCTSKTAPVAGGLDVSFSCTNPNSSGQGQVRFSDDSHYTMIMDVNTEATGAPQKVKVNSAGRWLSASCPAKPKG